MIILREREMKHDVSNNKRIKSFRVKRKEPSSGKKRNRSKRNQIAPSTHRRARRRRRHRPDHHHQHRYSFSEQQTQRRGEGFRSSAVVARCPSSLLISVLFCFFFRVCFASFFCGAALWENQVKKQANLLKQTPQNKAETTIHTRKRERERERERVEE